MKPFRPVGMQCPSQYLQTTVSPYWHLSQTVVLPNSRSITFVS